MTKISKKPYKGSRDFFPSIMQEQQYMFNKMHETSKLFSYEQYDGPILEEVELYLAKSGEELVGAQIYDFIDKGKRHVSIRPEMTPTVARMVAQVHRETPKPLRWYSIANFMRYEQPQKGRLREFIQLNVDILGAPEEMAAFEVLDYLVSLLTHFGATEKMFALNINDRILVDAVFEKALKLDMSQKAALYKTLDKAKKVSPEKLDSMIKETLSTPSQLQCFAEYLKLRSLEEVQSFCTEYSLDLSTSCLDKLLALVENSSLKEFVALDPTIVRGLDYYTGVVFECFDKHPDNRRAIAGGGAYANLLQIFNEPSLAGFGFGMGDVTLKDFLKSHKLMPDLSKSETEIILVPMDQESLPFMLKLAKSLRESGLKTEASLVPLKFNKALKFAQGKNIQFLSLVGETEQQSNEIQIKDLKSKESTQFSTKDTNAILKFIRTKNDRK